MGRRKKKGNPVRPERPKARPDAALPVPAVHPSQGYTPVWGAGVALIALAFLIIKSFALHDYTGDEYIYYYQSRLLSRGVPPYSGFDFAHPPLQLVFGALALQIFDYSTLLARLVPAGWTLLAGVLLAALVRREMGVTAALLAMLTFLFSYDVLRASTHFTGVNMTVALLFGAMLALRKDAVKTTAVLCTLAVFTRLYAIPGVIAIVLAAFIGDRRRGLRLCIAGAVAGLSAALLTGILCGFSSAMDNLIAYHAMKTPMDVDELSHMHWSVLFHNAVPLSLGALGALIAAGQFLHAVSVHRAIASIRLRLRHAMAASGTGLALLALCTALFFAVILLRMDRVWMYYYVPAIAFAAVCAGAVGGFFEQAIRDLLLRRISRLRRIAAVLVACAFAIAVWAAPLLEQKLNYFDDEVAKGDDNETTYTFLPSPLPGFVNDAVRALCWRDVRRVGERTGTLTFLLWHESRILDIADAAAADIRSLSRPDDLMFGDSGTVPLLALKTGRTIAGNEVDTNAQRYASGNRDAAAMVASIDAAQTGLIFLRMSGNRGFGVAGVPQLRRLVTEKYELARQYRTSDNKQFYLFRRKKIP